MFFKSTILILFSVLHLFIYGQKLKKINAKNISQQYGQVYMKNEPLDGHYRIKYDRWKTEISHFVNGKKEGLTQYLRKGKLKEEGLCKNNLREGKWNYFFYFSGELQSTTNYKKGLKEGEEITYSGNKIEKISNYENNLLNGWQFNYSYWGNLESKILYEKGNMKQSIHYFDDGTINKKCSFNEDNGFCVRFQRDSSKNINHKIIDTLFYQNEKLVKMKNFTNSNLNFEIQIELEKDTIQQFSKDILKISFYKQKKFKETYILYLNKYGYSSFEKESLVDFIINSYKCNYQETTDKFVDYYASPCKVQEYFKMWMEKHLVEEFYVKTENSIFKVKYRENVKDTEMDNLMIGCYLEQQTTHNNGYSNAG